MKIGRKIATVYNSVVDYFAYLAGILVVFIMITIGIEVVVRKLFGFSIVWAVEYSEHALLYITFLSTAWLLKKGQHVKIDVVLNYLNQREYITIASFISPYTGIPHMCPVWGVFVEGKYYFQTDDHTFKVKFIKKGNNKLGISVTDPSLFPDYSEDSIPYNPKVFPPKKIIISGLKSIRKVFNQPLKIEGRAWVIKKDNIDTDMIFHNRYLAITDVNEMGQYTFDNLKGYEDFAKNAKKGDIVVVGKNFGCGSSRQQAVDCFKSIGISVIIGESFGSIYERNAINNALPILSSTFEIP